MTTREWTLKLEDDLKIDRRLCREFIDAFVSEMTRQLREDRKCRIPFVGTLKITKDKVGMLGAGFTFLPGKDFAEMINVQNSRTEAEDSSHYDQHASVCGDMPTCSSER